MVKRSVAALRAQTRPLDGIVVVDGDSADGTREWLAVQADVTPLYIHNQGSGGGMHHGLALSYAQGYDWFWLLDDDAAAAPDALMQLCRGLEKRPEIRIINSLCVGEQDSTRPTAGALWLRDNPNDYLRGRSLLTVEEICAHADADGFLDSAGGQFYLGVLIHRSVVAQVGAVLTPLFIRGDEVEYSLRIMRAGYHIYSYIPSIVTHPNSRVQFVSVLGRRIVCEDVSPFKRYYALRNSLYIRREYYAGTSLLLYAARRAAGALFTDVLLYRDKRWRERFASLRAILRGVWDGLWFHPDARLALVLLGAPA